MKTLFLSLALVAMPATSAPFKPVVSCPLADGSKAVLLAQSHGMDGKSLYVEVDGKREPAFQDMPDTEFVGEVALAQCVDHVMIFALNYGPPYLKGVALRKNPRSHATERIYFAEKALPKWLYTSPADMLVVIPNLGNETDKKYLVYRYEADKGQPEESTPSDALPTLAGHLVKRVSKRR